MMPKCHAVTQTCDTQIKHWRGLSRCHAVTPLSKCVRVCVRKEGIGARAFSCRRRL